MSQNSPLRCFIFNDTRAEKHHGCETVMQHLFRALRERHVTVLGTLPIGQKLSEHHLQRCQQADVVIINGEGTLHHGAPYARYLLDCGVQAKARGQKVWLINSTWQDNPTEMLAQIAQFDGVYVRDRASLALIQDAVPQAGYAPDLTFAYPHDASTTSVSLPLLLTDSVYAHISDQMAAYAKQYQCLYAPIIRPLPTDPQAIGFDGKKLKKYRLYTWMHVLSFGWYKPRRYYQDLRLAQSQTLDYLTQLKSTPAVIAARYHALCFALQLGCPVLALDSNTHKVRSLLCDIGLNPDQRIINLEDLKAHTPAHWITQAQWPAHERELMTQFCQQAPRAIAQYFDLICGSNSSQEPNAHVTVC